jgi:hypothetical protein
MNTVKNITWSNGATALNPLQEFELSELYEIIGGDAPEMVAAAQESGRFEITNLEQVNWALRKIAALKAEDATTNDLAKTEIERITKWKESKLKSNKQSQSFFNALLENYANKRRETDPKYKGETTPYGKVGFTKKQAEWNYENEEDTADFLEAHEMQEHVKVVKGILNKTELKKELAIKRNVFVNDAGEVVDIATDKDGLISGMQYGVKFFKSEETGEEWSTVCDVETGEAVEDVWFEEIVAVLDGVKVVPGITLKDQPDAITIKVEA